MNILYLILARGGSKGLTGKNLRQIDGHSLIAWKAASVRAFDKYARLVISTDSEEIALEAKANGVEVPFRRPDELATDTASSDQVIEHALDWFAANDKVYDAVCLLEPSSPFTKPEHYGDAIAKFRAENASLVCGMRETYPSRQFIWPMFADGRIDRFCHAANDLRDSRRQVFGPEWTVCGNLYLFSWEAFKVTGHIYGRPEQSYGILMDRWHACEIEDADDLEYARWVASTGRVTWPL